MIRVVAGMLASAMTISAYAVQQVPVLPPAIPVPAMPALMLDKPTTTQAATKFRLRFDRIALTDLVNVAYSDVLHRAFVIDSSLASRTDVVSAAFENKSEKAVLAVLRALTESLGGEVVQKGGVDVYRIRSADDKSDYQAFLYETKYRTADYVIDHTQGLIKGDFAGREKGNSSTPTAMNAGKNSAGQGVAEVSNTSKTKTGIVLLNASPAELDKFKTLAALVDTPERDVVVRAYIYEVSNVGQQQTALSVLFNTGKFHAGLNAGAATAANSVSLGFGGFELIANAVEGDSRFTLVDAPTLKLKSGESAALTVGSQIMINTGAVLDKNGNPVVTKTQQQTGLTFNVTVDASENNASITLNQTLSSNSGTAEAPNIINRQLNTVFSAKYRETVVLGGLREQREQKDKSGLSFLPFTLSKSNSKTNSEYIVVLEIDKV